MKPIIKYFLSFVFFTALNTYSLPPAETFNDNSNDRILDTDSWIDANRVLMFVTNKGSFAFDQGGMFGKNDGFYFPYLGIESILDGTARNTVCFAAGIWIAGVDSATGDTLVSVAEYSDDYFPGPIVNGTYVPNANNLPQYRVYKLYADSQASNPNQDYLDWPSAQGAPVDNVGNPRLFGDQTLWSVFNDANPNAHHNNASTNSGLGIEIQHTVWASGQDGEDTIPVASQLETNHIGSSSAIVQVLIVDAASLTDNEYLVYIGNDPNIGPVWNLKNITSGTMILENQTTFANNNETVTDGFLVRVRSAFYGFDSFEVVANAGGPLDPPAGGAFDFQGFPSVPPGEYQQVGPAIWAFHVRDNGGSAGGGNIDTYADFLSLVASGGSKINPYDYEIRFTGTYSNPGINGSYAFNVFSSSAAWVPFELWRIGNNTSDDVTDDVRMTTRLFDINDNGIYDLANWGTSFYGGGLLEHSASPDDDDPYTDYISWYLPSDTSPGESGYLDDVENMADGIFFGSGTILMSRTVLINWNGGDWPPFNQDLPEQGTVFRIKSAKQIPVDSFTFNAIPPATLTAGPEAVSIYAKCKLINKSNKTYNNFFISLWFDPDIGDAGDDFVGCDTTNDIFYSYNDGLDLTYGAWAPAVGGRLLEGPIVSSAGDTAFVDGVPVPDFKNLRMYSFMKYINGTDPQSPTWTYQYMNGLDASQGGTPLANGTRFAVPGDPVAGTGDLDVNSSDRRMMATFGPINFAPNDTQQIVFKLAVGQGTDHLSSITELKQILSFVPSSNAEPISYISPEPQRVVFMNTIVPFHDSIFVGWTDGSSVLNIDGASLAVNDSILPESATLLLSHPGHNGPVWKLKVNARQFLSPYGYVYDTVHEAFLVGGELTDGTPFSVTGSFRYVGHRRGDINRNGRIDITDLTFLIDHIFRGGPAPTPIESGDANRDGRISILDLTRLVDIIFRGG